MWSSSPDQNFANVQGQSMIERYWKDVTSRRALQLRLFPMARAEDASSANTSLEAPFSSGNQIQQLPVLFIHEVQACKSSYNANCPGKNIELTHAFECLASAPSRVGRLLLRFARHPRHPAVLVVARTAAGTARSVPAVSIPGRLGLWRREGGPGGSDDTKSHGASSMGFSCQAASHKKLGML